MSVYYLTYTCRFRCPYCSDGAGQPYYQLASQMLPGHKVLELLKIMRHSDYLVITGGEPLEHPEVAQVLQGIRKLKFRGVVFTTNGYAIEPFLKDVAESVDSLVFSLQTLDPKEGNVSYRAGPGIHEQVMANIQRAKLFPGRKYEIVISSVVTPENIPDLYEVYRFSQKNGFRLAACPQLVGVKAHRALVGNPEYQRFYDFLIAEKKKGASIQGTVDYLEYMRDLKKFSCRPFTMLVVSPLGDVFYPCLELGQFAGNLLEEPDLHRLRRKGREKFGPQPDCDTRCHSACALGFSRLLANPASALHEVGLRARGALRRFR